MPGALKAEDLAKQLEFTDIKDRQTLVKEVCAYDGYVQPLSDSFGLGWSTLLEAKRLPDPAQKSAAACEENP